MMRKPAVILLAALALLCFRLRGGSQEPAPKVAPAKGTLSDFMERKQRLAHEVFDALVLKDFKRVAKDANSLFALSRAAEWQVVKTPRYVQFSTEFQQATEKMAQSAREANLETTTRAFGQMTLCCARCHEYVRGRQP
jgi:hypothetical protein